MCHSERTGPAADGVRGGERCGMNFPSANDGEERTQTQREANLLSRMTWLRTQAQQTASALLLKGENSRGARARRRVLPRRAGASRLLRSGGGVLFAGLLLVLAVSACAQVSPPERAKASASSPGRAPLPTGAAGVLDAQGKAGDASEKAFTRTAWTLPGEQAFRASQSSSQAGSQAGSQASSGADEGWVLGTDNYRVYTTAASRIADRLPSFLESALTHYTSTLLELPMPTKPMETYFLGTRGQWERVTQRLMGSDAGIYLRIDRGGYSSRGRSVFYDIGPRDTFVIAAHESWHQYTQSVFAEAMPLALEEGIATYMEGFRWTGQDRTKAEFLPWRNFERFGQLRDAVAGGELLSLQELLVTSPQDLLAREGSQAALRYYAQVWALIHFLVEGEGGKHKQALLTLVRDAQEGGLASRVQGVLGERAARSVRMGRRGVDVLSAYTGVASEELDGAYQAFAREIVQTGAGTKISQGQSPIAR